jgi:hypothetical protein
LESGKQVVAVSGSGLLGLATSTPLWRDLHVGDQGPDVQSLADELVQLGKISASGSTMTRAMVTAFNALAKDAGLPVTPETVSASQVLWLPSHQAVPAACKVGVGTMVNPGDGLISFAPELVGAWISPVPDGLTPGDRVLVIDGKQVPVDADGKVSRDGLPAVAAGQQFRMALTSEQTSITGQFQLAQPIEATVIPPVAFVAKSATQGCVSAGGRGYPVTVIGSQLGQTFVDFGEGTSVPESVDLTPAGDLTCS